MTGVGEVFTVETSPLVQTQKKNTGNVIGTNHGTATVNHLADCEKDLQAAHEKIGLLNTQLELQAKLIRVYEAQQPTR